MCAFVTGFRTCTLPISFGPLIHARQRRGGIMLVETLARDRAVAEVGRGVAQRRLGARPIVERGLERRCDMPGIGIPGEIVRNDDQLAVTAVLEAGEFHGDPSSVRPEADRSEEHTSELQSLMRISYAVFCLKKKKQTQQNQTITR